jgi:hypothetical protein
MDQTRGTLAPFTKTELLDGLAAVMPPDAVEEFRIDLRDLPDEPGLMTISDGMLLILAALSSDYGERVIRARPELRDEVLAVRADPAAFLERARRQGHG